MIADSVRRIQEADAEAEASQLAFVSGNFFEFMQAKHERLKKRVDADYAAMIAEQEKNDGSMPPGGPSTD